MTLFDAFQCMTLNIWKAISKWAQYASRLLTATQATSSITQVFHCVLCVSQCFMSFAIFQEHLTMVCDVFGVNHHIGARTIAKYLMERWYRRKSGPMLTVFNGV